MVNDPSKKGFKLTSIGRGGRGPSRPDGLAAMVSVLSAFCVLIVKTQSEL